MENIRKINHQEQRNNCFVLTGTSTGLRSVRESNKGRLPPSWGSRRYICSTNSIMLYREMTLPSSWLPCSPAVPLFRLQSRHGVPSAFFCLDPSSATLSCTRVRYLIFKSLHQWAASHVLRHIKSDNRISDPVIRGFDLLLLENNLRA